MENIYIVALGSAACTGLITWGSFKAVLNGTREKVRVLESNGRDVEQRLSRMEGKIDLLLERE